MSDLSDLLARLRALREAGTPGGCALGSMTAGGARLLVRCGCDQPLGIHPPEDAALIAAAVNALPHLLDALAHAGDIRGNMCDGCYHDIDNVGSRIDMDAAIRAALAAIGEEASDA